jgi:hypothetical protein
MGGSDETHPLGNFSPLLVVRILRRREVETCSSRAQNCVMKWGGPRTACYEAFRLAACERTGKYVAPNGNVWPADRTGRRTDGQG